MKKYIKENMGLGESLNIVLYLIIMAVMVIVSKQELMVLYIGVLFYPLLMLVMFISNKMFCIGLLKSIKLTDMAKENTRHSIIKYFWRTKVKSLALPLVVYTALFVFIALSNYEVGGMLFSVTMLKVMLLYIISILLFNLVLAVYLYTKIKAVDTAKD